MFKPSLVYLVIFFVHLVVKLTTKNTKFFHEGRKEITRLVIFRKLFFRHCMSPALWFLKSLQLHNSLNRYLK